MRLKSALRRGVAAAVIAGIVVSSGIPAYAAPWNIADGDITVKAGDTEGTNWVTQGKKEDVKDTDTVITGESKEHTVTIDTSGGKVDVTFDDLKIDVSGKTEGDGSGDGSTRESNAAVTVKGDHDAAIELDGDNKLKSGSGNAGLEKNKQESKGTLTIKDDKGKDGSLTAEGGEGGAGIGGGAERTGSNITIRGGTIEAVGGAGAAGIGDGIGAQQPEIDQDTPPSNPNHIIICGDAEVTAKAGRSQMLDAKAPAIGGKYGEVPTENLSDEEHKVTGGRLTRLNADGTVMEGMGYDYTSTPKPQPDDDEDDDDDDVPPPVQENAPEPLPGGMVVGGFFSSRVTIQQLDLSGVTESGIGPMVGSVKASDAGEDLTSRGAVLIESAAPRSTVTTDISSLREDGVEDIFFRYEDTMTHYSVDKMADAAGEDADVELKQNKEDISLRLDGETRDDLSERYLEWVPVQTPEPQERLILTHKEVEQKTSEELRRELDELRKQELERGFQFAKKRDDLPSLDWWLEPARAETVKQKTSEELRRELDELRKQELEMGFQFAKKRDDRPSLDWWLEPARTETPRIGLEESLKQLASRFEAIAPEEDKPRLFLLETTVPDGTKYTNLLESDLRSYADRGDDWDDLPDTQGEIKLWIPEDLGQPKEISILKESLSRSDGIA
jgi:ribosomal protein L29